MRVSVRAFALLVVFALMLAGCGQDDGAAVRVIGDGGSASASGSASGPGSVSGSGAATGVTAALGGYEPVSDVASHAKITLDVCGVAAALEAEPPDFGAAGRAYAEGGNSMKGDGEVRTLQGFAASPLDEPTWQAYAAHFGDETWLDTYVTDALDGTGRFEGAADDVRTQGVAKGIQNGVLVMWVLHELDAAAAKVEDGNTDPAEGAPHNIDEGWAFYHGENPDCAPFATADKRGEDFGTGSAVNDSMLEQFTAARDAAAAGDVDALAAADAEIRRQILITYLQAATKYATRTGEAVEAGDTDDARKQQAEGHAFYRVIAPQVADRAPDADAALSDVLGGDELPTKEEADAAVAELAASYDALAVTEEEIGTLQ